MYRIVLLRHGQSLWNKENRFTGWTDIDLSPQGIQEAKIAGQTLKKENYSLDIAFTSILVRAIHTTKIVLAQMDLAQIQVKQAWQLNERHYGALQGMNKSEMAQKYGEDQVFKWRRSYNLRPPQIEDPKKGEPAAESLQDTYNRCLPYWNSDIAPAIKENKRVLISAHGNSLRAIIKHLDNVSDTEISNLNIPTGIPLVYELNDQLKPTKHYYLGDQNEINQKIKEIADQGK